MKVFDELVGCVGDWSGTNTLRDPEMGEPTESPSTLSVMPILGGRFVRLDYTWVYQGKPQDGSVLVCLDPETGELSGNWIDTWHTGVKPMGCSGTVPARRTISLKGSYAAPPGPDWGWRIDIAPGDDTVRITHTNVHPDGNEEQAAEGVYSRA